MFSAPQSVYMLAAVAALVMVPWHAVAADETQNRGWGAFFMSISKTPEIYAKNVRNCPVWNDASQLCGMIKRVYSPLMDQAGGADQVIADERAVKFLLAAVTNGIFVSNRSPREALKCPKTWQPEAPLITPKFESNGVVVTMRSYRSEIVGDTCLLELVE